MTDLLEGLRDLRKLAELGDHVPTEELQALLTLLREVGETLSKPDLEAIQAELAALETLTAAQRDVVTDRLTELARSREGIQGYNHLQAFHTAQRLSKRA